MEVQKIRESIDRVLENRRLLVPELESRMKDLQRQAESVASVRECSNLLLEIEHEPDRRMRIEEVLSSLDMLDASIHTSIKLLEALRSRFSRETVCIGVSGMARVGKSTTLQKMSGLSDDQIPTGSKQNVTAVHSIIHNCSEGKPRAEISFLTKNEFLEHYIAALIANVNAVLPDKDKLEPPSSLLSLESLQLPKDLGSGITSVASDSLKRLRDAIDSIGSFQNYLSSAKRTIVLEGESLQSFKGFVSYPENDSPEAERPYLAVKGVEIYCPFPSIRDIKLSLVDLPGFGEINEGVAKGHIDALNERVDHILDILKPSDTSGSLTQSDGNALDLLDKVQPAITSRENLLTIGINIFDTYADNAKTLKCEFNNRYNDARSNPFTVELYHANDQESVFTVFEHILENLAVNLPAMDVSLIDEALSIDTSNRHGEISSIQKHLSVLASSVPLPEKILNDEIQSVSNQIIHNCQAYENQLAESSGKKSSAADAFIPQVNSCRDEVKSQLEDGFFLGKEQWKARARGNGDYYAFFRSECRRIRREIINCYDRLDEFYVEHTDHFKKTVLDTVFSNAGDLITDLGIAATDDIDSEIDALHARLSTIVMGTGILPALELLKSTRFTFKHNVFLNIAPHLSELLNPNNSRTRSEETYRIEALGGVGDPDIQVEKIAEYLKELGTRANDEVAEALRNADDRFNEYLSICMSFFIDNLWRMDEEAFRHVLVRKLLTEFPDAIVGDETAAQRDSKQIEMYRTAIDQVNRLLASTSTPYRPVPEQSLDVSPKATKGIPETSTAKPRTGETTSGIVTRTSPKAGVFVDFGGPREGLVKMNNLKKYLGAKWVNDPADYFQPGQEILVHIDKIHENGNIDLSITR